MVELELTRPVVEALGYPLSATVSNLLVAVLPEQQGGYQFLQSSISKIAKQRRTDVWSRRLRWPNRAAERYAVLLRYEAQLVVEATLAQPAYDNVSPSDVVMSIVTGQWFLESHLHEQWLITNTYHILHFASL